MTSSDLDEIQKRCECHARMAGECVCGAWNEPDNARLVSDDIECNAQIDGGCGACERCDPYWWLQEANKRIRELEQRLALLEPVWEAAKEWRMRHEARWKQTQRRSPDPMYVHLPDDVAALSDAIDAAVAKEGK